MSGKMAQQVEELATLLDDLSSSHRTHVVEPMLASCPLTSVRAVIHNKETNKMQKK